MPNYKALEKKLTLPKKSCWEIWSEAVKKQAFAFAENYKAFLNRAKTEREAVRVGIEMAKKKGYKDINEIKSLKAGDKVYFIQKGQSMIFAKIGKKGVENGLKIVMSHIDSPHLDFKINPLYEDEGIAFLKTHYYGGIKKYQWPTIALALHGVVYLENGKEVEINIGENEKDPVFMITDLLPHLERKGMAGSKEGQREVVGEELNLVVGSIPIKDEKIKEKIKLAVLEYLNKNYKMTEEDFSSADLQAVPSEKARDLGFDRSLISAYGHDDKICSFAGLESLIEAKQSNQTQVCVWVDREEIGSEGSTSAQSTFIELFVSELLRLSNQPYGFNDVHRVFSKSKAISSDVTAALDPDYKDVFDIKNAQRMGYGVAVEKYVGAGGKYYTSEASEEFLRELRIIFKKNKNIVFQMGGGLGKIDTGGGGTIAKYMANRNMDIVDSGVPLFNMHAPLEIASKADLYCAYLAYKAFFEA